MLSIREYLEAGETTISNLLFDHYQKIGLKDDEFLFLLQLFRSQNAGDLFPDLMAIAETMGKTPDTIYKLLNQLVSRGFIRIETQQNQKGQMMDTYDLLPVFQKIQLFLQTSKEKQVVANHEDEIKQLYQGFEKEFHYSTELIRLALREAVLNQAYSLKYIDRILLAWERKNITTKEQVAADQKKRKDSMIQNEIEQQGQTQESLPKVTLHNWLNPEDSE